ncbi:MAG: NADH-quinone oxidoreductase subunit C [Candidatus Heimdallarchaeota archaeon]
MDLMSLVSKVKIISTAINEKQELPALLKNLKKIFGNNIKGPISQGEREYMASIKHSYVLDIARFFSNRGVTRLAAISSWDNNQEISIAYHFIATIGKAALDSKITITSFLPKEASEIISIREFYPSARIFEDEIKEKFNLSYKE